MLVERKAGGPSALPISIRPINGALKLRAYDTSGIHVGVAAEDDGTLRHQLVAWETSAPAAQIRVRAETDGTLRMQLIGSDDQGTTQRYIDTEATGELRVVGLGWNGSAVTRVALETTGEQKTSNYGKTAGGTLGAFRLNASNQIQVEVVGSTFVASARGVLGRTDLSATTNTDVYTVPSSTTANVVVRVCNRNATPVDIRLALHDGTVANEDYIYYDYTIGPYGTLVEKDIELDTADVVMAYSDTANVSVVVSGVEYA